MHLAEDTERNQQSIEELAKAQWDFARSAEQEMHDQRRAIERLAAAFERLSAHEEAKRKILKLELENQLLRQARGLPPAKQPPAAEPEVNEAPDEETP